MRTARHTQSGHTCACSAVMACGGEASEHRWDVSKLFSLISIHGKLTHEH